MPTTARAGEQVILKVNVASAEPLPLVFRSTGIGFNSCGKPAVGRQSGIREAQDA
jgi:hypothetical protein